MGKSKYLVLLVLCTCFLLHGLAEEIPLNCPTQFNVVRVKRSDIELKNLQTASTTSSTLVPTVDYYDPDEEPPNPNENCTLPANYTRTAVSQEDQVSFSSLINGDFDSIINYNEHQDVILIMGNTGVGKTTITQILAGDLNTIHAKYTQTQKLVIVDNAEKIGAPSIVSRTLVPELVLKTDPSTAAPVVAFYDCPGFDDTRGPAQDVATSFFMNQIIKKVSRVKMLFLVPQSSVGFDDRGLHFDKMVQNAITFVKNVTDYKDSIGLVVTKVKRYDDQGKEVNDRRILRSIRAFLISYVTTKALLLYNQDLDAKERVINNKKIEFVNILLEQDANGRSSKISFSVNPEKCGPLSESLEVSRNKARITRLYEGLEYGSVVNKTDGFGLPLKEETKLKIVSDYLPEIHNATVSKISGLVNNFKNWFDQVKLARMGSYSTSVASEFNKAVQQTILVLNNMVVNLRKASERESSDGYEKFGTILKRGFSELGYHIPKDLCNFMKKQNDLIDYFDKIRGTNTVVRPINDWIHSLSTLSAYIMEYKYWYEFCAELQNILTSYDFHQNKSKFTRMENQVNWLEFVEVNNILSVNQNIKSLQAKFGGESRQVRLLKEMMEYATVPTTMSCTSNTLTVEGHFVRFSEFVQSSHKRILFPSSCSSISQSTKFTVEIYAANTVFIDESLDGVGLEINLVLISPKWVVINNVNLNFDGMAASAILPRKAYDGGVIYLHAGSPGQDGIAGKPGGPGGSFLGVASKISEGNKLKISSNGGSGGAGQNGGDGGAGSQGKPPTKDDTYLENSFDVGVTDREWRKFWGHPGYPGGKGGDGGVGGWGGYPGQIKINSLADSSALSVRKSANKGIFGNGGLGGNGGAGGAPGSGMHCDAHRILGFTRTDSCDLIPSSHSKAPDGQRGHDNRSRLYFEMPLSPQYRIDEVKSIMYFKNRFNAVLDVDVHKFREKLDDYLSTQV